MIGPPGLPKFGRRVFAFARAPQMHRRVRLLPLKLAAGVYLAGAAAHFSHHMAFDLPTGADPSLNEALISAPMSLIWPAVLVGTLIKAG